MLGKKATLKASLVDIRQNFAHYMDLAGKGKVIELTESRKPVGFLAPASAGGTYAQTYPEAGARSNLYEIFDSVAKGEAVMISRLSGPDAVFIPLSSAEVA